MALDVLKPFGGVTRRILNFQHLDAATCFVGFQRMHQFVILQVVRHHVVRQRYQTVGQVDRVFDR